jgi:hypothetical protein
LPIYFEQVISASDGQPSRSLELHGHRWKHHFKAGEIFLPKERVDGIEGRLILSSFRGITKMLFTPFGKPN